MKKVKPSTKRESIPTVIRSCSFIDVPRYIPIIKSKSAVRLSVERVLATFISFFSIERWRYRLITYLQSANTKYIQILAETGKKTMAQIDRKFGVEIEFVHERNETRNIYREIEAKFPTWEIKGDMSIRPYGTEINSPILSGDKGLADVAAMLDYLNSNSAIRVNKSCGLHVHVDAADLTSEQVLSVSQRYADNEESFFDKLMPKHRNEDNRYCYSAKLNNLRSGISSNIEIMKKVFVSFDGFKSNSCFDKYRKVNIGCRSHGTIEFRHHHATLNKNEIINWVKLVTNFVEASKAGFSLKINDEDFVLPSDHDNEMQKIMEKYNEMGVFFNDFDWHGTMFTHTMQDMIFYNCRLNLFKYDYETFLANEKNKIIIAHLERMGFTIKEVQPTGPGRYNNSSEYISAELFYGDKSMNYISNEAKIASRTHVGKICQKIENKIIEAAKKIDLFEGIPTETIYFYSKLIEKKNKKLFLARQKLLNFIEENPGY